MAERSTLIGRDTERAALARLLEAAREGESRTLVLRGEPGVGKTALLGDTIDLAGGFRALRAVGVEAEMELAYAAVQQLCAPLLDQLPRLPGPQREALRVAFGLSAGQAPDRFLVGLAVLSLLSQAAEEQPLLCGVDDAQWLDEASALTLAFVARRLLAEPIAMLFVAREQVQALTGLPEVVVRGLADQDARQLLTTAIRWPIDERVRETVIAETRGNPLALLELPRGLTPAELAGGFALPDARPLAERIEQSFLRRIQPLPPDSQWLLRIASAEPTGSVTLLWRAAGQLGIGPEAVAPAEGAGLVSVDGRVRFRHPLVRSAVYRTASPDDRRTAHRVLAEVTDSHADPDRRAWHRAYAATGLDEAVAGELERSASRAQARGGVAAMAAFLERAAELTPDPRRRGTRALAAAQAKLEAGAPEAAQALLAIAELVALDDAQRAGLQRLRGQIAFALRRGNDAPALLLRAARQFEPIDAQSAGETYLEAFGAAVYAGREGLGGGAAEVAEAARGVPLGPWSRWPADLLLDGLTKHFTEPYPQAWPALDRALRAIAERAGHGEGELRWLWTACPVAPEPLSIELWDDEMWHGLATLAVTLARDGGALAVLPIALSYRACAHLHAGEFAAASALIEEADAISRATGNAPLRYTSMLLQAWRGREAEALGVIEPGLKDAAARGEGRAVALAHYATAVLYNGLGRHPEALAAARRACAHEDLGLYGWALMELIEAAVRTGDRQSAQAALAQLAERTRTSGTQWALGTLAWFTALLTDGADAEDAYREAVDRLGRSRVAVHLARAELAYGEWLRRANRRVDARTHLRAAHGTFSRMGAEAFADRARRELLATGATARRRTVDTRDELTPQEAQIARLARDGLSSPEIAAQLFISPRTVQYHLGKVFAKLNLNSRNQLNRVPLSRLGVS